MKVQVHYDTAATTANQIETYMNCRKCVAELPDGVSPKEYARTQIGVLHDGRLQVWCNRHECNVAVLSMKAVRSQQRKSATHAHGEEKCAVCDAAFPDIK